MVHFIMKSSALKRTCISVSYIKLFKRNYVDVQPISKKIIHPYKQIHYWKSIEEFSQDLCNNIIFNKGGLVAINKPYGITRTGKVKYTYGISNAVNYSLEDALPYISNHLQYPDLTIVRSPERYMTGVTLLAADRRVHHAVEISLIRANYLANKYWLVTINSPIESEGEHRLAMKLLSRPDYEGKKAVIVTSWTRNDEKLRRVKLLNTRYKVLSKSILNLCSLVEVASSTKRWHALRLFASTFLYSPILGDNFCGTRVRKVGNTYVKVNPFFDDVGMQPKLDKKLLNLLNVSPAQQNIIPAHLHLKSAVLPFFFGETVTIDAPVMPPFDWTYKQLEFQDFV